MILTNFLKKLLIFDVLFGKNKRTLTNGSNADLLHYHFTPNNLLSYIVPIGYQYLVHEDITIESDVTIDGDIIVL
jgi:hypothetical protein